MTAYGNGDMCSRLLYSALNNAYLMRASSHCSYFKEKNEASEKNALPTIKPHVKKNGVYIKMFPPTGETV